MIENHQEEILRYFEKDSPMPKRKISMPEYNGLSSITMARETKIFSSIVYRFISVQHLKKRFNHTTLIITQKS